MVACPIQVTVGAEALARSAAPSLATRGTSLGRAAAQARLHMNVKRAAAEALWNAGLVFRKPPSTWCAGWPGTGSVPTAAHAVASTTSRIGRAQGRTGCESTPKRGGGRTRSARLDSVPVRARRGEKPEEAQSLAESVAVDPEEAGRLELVARRQLQRLAQKWHLDTRHDRPVQAPVFRRRGIAHDRREDGVQQPVELLDFNPDFHARSFRAASPLKRVSLPAARTPCSGGTRPARPRARPACRSGFRYSPACRPSAPPIGALLGTTPGEDRANPVPHDGTNQINEFTLGS